jgi:hypothetical protein
LYEIIKSGYSGVYDVLDDAEAVESEAGAVGCEGDVVAVAVGLGERQSLWKIGNPAGGQTLGDLLLEERVYPIHSVKKS